ncbi:tetratricopeptide repeat protein [Bradyrhizobium erythrophlei]|nr:tetratricopeptide repeat protein [Bradyrhizobium erythrophlei]
MLTLSSADAQSQNWKWCAKLVPNVTPDMQIFGCKALIKSDSTSRPDAAFSYNLGNGYYDKQDYQLAIANYNDALRIRPRDVHALKNRGRAYHFSGDYDRAIADYNEVIRLSPDDSVPFFLRGLANYRKKDYDRAISDYDQALLLNPTDEESFGARGNAYFDKKDYDRAIASYNEALRIKPNYLNALHNRGRSYEIRNNYDAAIADFGDVIRIDPTNASVRNERCWLRAITGHDLQEALLDCDESLRLNPDGHALNSRGLVQLKLGAFDRAITDYDAAIIFNGNDADSLYGRGVAKLKLGDTAADIAAAKAVKADIADVYSSYGIDGISPVAGISPAATPPTAQTVQTAPSAAGDCSRAETHWKSAEDIRTLAAYQDHLKRFPNCDFAGLAAARIEQLSRN